MNESISSGTVISEKTAATSVTSEEALSKDLESTMLEDSFNEFRAIKLLKLLNPSNKLKYHELLETDFLSEFQKTDRFAAKFTIKVITWNLCQCSPPREFGTMLMMKSGGNFADLYVLTFQETVSLKSFSHSGTVIDQWCEVALMSLPSGYKIVHKSGLLGLTTVIVASGLLSDEITDVNVDNVGLGYLSWYNKGCISVCFNVGKIGDAKLSGLPIQILNMHLSHGEDESSVSNRMKNLQKVGNTFSLVNSSAHLTTDSAHSYVDNVERALDLSDIELEKMVNELVSFGNLSEALVTDGIIILSGDMNFRISDLDRESILRHAKAGDYQALCDHEELCNLMQQKLVLNGFKEAPIHFLPTFKVKCSGEYDIKRRPAYTDRVVYCGPKDTIKQLTYGNYSIGGSDHLPVYSEFLVDTLFVHASALKLHRDKFDEIYTDVISKMELLEIEPQRILNDCCAGLEEIVEITFRNLCDETLNYKVVEQDKSFFRQSAFQIDDTDCSIEPKSEKRLLFKTTPNKICKIVANYEVSLRGFDFSKIVSIVLNVESIIGVGVNELKNQQFDNIMKSFSFILHAKPNFKLTSHLLDIESLDSLTSMEQQALKDITLRTVDFSSIGDQCSLVLLDVLYMWMKLVPDINIGTARGKAVFTRLIDLIKFLGMDNVEAYKYFGFLFNDENEILDYLESTVH
ncbi:hypothetical protein FOA43_003781 [Brettanomyces nanus]|uniref:Inositol polyphosphate-related phosphatase domain-containing protein n=1 Tax=Eeniella nana TaxID=13502 RepID=A0A875S953_EENNA|nr:uncharacterized protein FOA43_003781 [Brettanomyces nanus]QPG76392.1 hypothetical protein FOA43_003781 [Brettanomyces nanus]